MDSYKLLDPQTDAVVTEWKHNTKCFLSDTDSCWPYPSCFWSAILGTSVRWVWDTTTWRGTQPTAPPSTWTSCGRWWASRPGSTMAKSLKDLPPSSMLCALWVVASICYGRNVFWMFPCVLMFWWQKSNFKWELWVLNYFIFHAGCFCWLNSTATVLNVLLLFSYDMGRYMFLLGVKYRIYSLWLIM